MRLYDAPTSPSRARPFDHVSHNAGWMTSQSHIASSKP
jgi:hypothetical protein